MVVPSLYNSISFWQRANLDSTRPFSRVKKKDGTWRMCVGYWALNKVIIPDKHLISTINEPLDEQHVLQVYN